MVGKCRGARRGVVCRPCARAGAGRGAVLLSGRRGRSDHQDHRRLRGRLREGEPRHQAAPDLFRQLSGVHREGVDRREERRAAGHVDPAVDRHVHAHRRGRHRAVRRPHQDARGSRLAEELLSGVHGEQPDGRQDVGHSVSAVDHRALLQQGSLQGGGSRPQQAAGDLARDDRVRAEAHQARRIGPSHAVGRPDSIVGVPVLAVPGTRDRKRRKSHEPGGNRGLLRQARGHRGAAVLGRPREQVQGASAGNRGVGHHAEGLLRAQGGDDLDHHRQPHERQEQREVRLRRRHAAGEQATGQSHGRREFLPLQEVDPAAARGRVQVHQVGDVSGACGAVGHRHRLRRGAQGRVGHVGHEAIRRRLSRGGGRARPAPVRQGRAVDARQPARHQGAERRPAGCAHGHQETGSGDEGRAARGRSHPEGLQEGTLRSTRRSL